jgi:hypothetical protein
MHDGGGCTSHLGWGWGGVGVGSGWGLSWVRVWLGIGIGDWELGLGIGCWFGRPAFLNAQPRYQRRRGRTAKQPGYQHAPRSYVAHPALSAPSYPHRPIRPIRTARPPEPKTHPFGSTVAKSSFQQYTVFTDFRDRPPPCSTTMMILSKRLMLQSLKRQKPRRRL